MAKHNTYFIPVKLKLAASFSELSSSDLPGKQLNTPNKLQPKEEKELESVFNKLGGQILFI